MPSAPESTIDYYTVPAELVLTSIDGDIRVAYEPNTWMLCVLSDYTPPVMSRKNFRLALSLIDVLADAFDRDAFDQWVAAVYAAISVEGGRRRSRVRFKRPDAAPVSAPAPGDPDAGP